MTNAGIALSKTTHFYWAKPFRTSATFILTTLLLVVAAATSVATGQTYTDLYNFNKTHGYFPSFPNLLAQGRDGNLYGTTTSGGTNRYGVVFKLAPSGKLNVLYNFDGIHGWDPSSGLTLGAEGNLYGTTEGGGDNGFGTIFKITKSGSLTTLHSFTGGADDGCPLAPPIQGADGNFYGTTGGTCRTPPIATAYKITSSGSFTVLGSLPWRSDAPLLQGTDGNFYGTTILSGSDTVFKMTPKGIVTIIYNFDQAHGDYPSGPLIQAGDSNLYGTTVLGGRDDAGVVFKLTPRGAITVLHSFGDPNYPNDGRAPFAGLVPATDGNFYGITAQGGTLGYGVIFRITAAGVYSVLYNLDVAHGAGALSTPRQHTNGKIYGLTYGGGTSGKGVVYSFDVGLAPFVRTVSNSGKVGRVIGILGEGLTGTSNVSFNGTSATFTVFSDTYLTTTVPSGATTGFVKVTTPGGALTSSQEFRVKR